jgi:hypothetical protein
MRRVWLHLLTVLCLLSGLMLVLFLGESGGIFVYIAIVGTLLVGFGGLAIISWQLLAALRTDKHA